MKDIILLVLPLAAAYGVGYLLGLGRGYVLGRRR